MRRALRDSLIRPATCLVVLLAFSVSVAAQTNTGEISGVVRDAQGGALPGARVIAEHVDSGVRVEYPTDEAGRYHLLSLRVGMYVISVELPGFRRIVRSGVLVQLGQALNLDFTLDVGGPVEEIRVTASVPLLQTGSAEISDVIENQQVVQLPLNGRNFLALAQLSDAVVIPPGGTRGDSLQQAGPLPNVGGQRSGHNIYLLDGVKVTDELFNNLVINPSVDSIQEFKIQKSQYPAEFGGKASALINVATRAGANSVRGSLFEFFRHDQFDAHNFFDPKDQPVPPLRQNQFGGALGGPVVRDRSFFFVSYEGQRARRSLTRTFSVPTEAVRGGDFSGSGTICDPLTITTSGACTPFANNRIPIGRLDPLAVTFLEQVPLPTSNAALQNLTSIEQQAKDMDQFSLRLDHRFDSGDQLFARVSTFDADEVQPFGSSSLQETLVPGFGRTLNTKARNAVVSHTHISSRFLNELRFGWMHVTGGQVSANRGVDFASQVGLQGVTNDPRDMGYPQISTRGLYSVFGDPTTFTYRDNQHFELYENVLFDRGAHRIKFGGYFFHLQFRPEQPDNARGAFTYTGQFTGNAFADFLLGYPTTAVTGIGRGDENGRTNWFHVFAQDDWRVRSNLTVNLGLRYEYNQHMRDEANRLSSVDFETPGGRYVIASDDDGVINSDAAGLLPLMPVPYVTSAEAGWDRGLLGPSKLRLAPRTGFALSFDRDRAVVRGGYGIFLNQWAYSVQTAFARNLPYFFTRQVDVPTTQRVPSFQTRNILTADPTGVAAPNIMDHDYAVEYTQTWSGGLQYELLPSTMVEVAYMGSWTLGADNATIRNVPEPGRGIGSKPTTHSSARSDSHDPLRWEVDLSRPHPQGRAAPASRLFLLGELHAVVVHRRCLEPGSDGSRDERAAGRAQRVRRDRRVGRVELRPSSSVRRKRHISAAVLPGCWRPEGRRARRVARQRRLLRAVRRAVHREPWRRPGQHRKRTGAASGPTEGSESAIRRAAIRSLVRYVSVCLAGALHVWQRAAKQRDRSWVREPRSRRCEDVECGRHAPARTAVGGLQRAQQGELRHPKPHLRH